MTRLRVLAKVRSAWRTVYRGITEASLEIYMYTSYSEPVERELLKQRYRQLLRLIDKEKKTTWKIRHSTEETTELKLKLNIVVPVADRRQLWRIHDQALTMINEVFPAATMAETCSNMGKQPQRTLLYGGST